MAKEWWALAVVPIHSNARLRHGISQQRFVVEVPFADEAVMPEA
jgi:hypothetical protein